MTDRDDDRDDAGASTGAYVLHSLDGDDRVRFERSLTDSEDLRAEVAELADTAVELGLAVPSEAPPPELRSRILDAVARTPQSDADPAPGGAPAGAVVAPSERAARRWSGRAVASFLSAAAAVAVVATGGFLASAAIGDSEAQQLAEIAAASDFSRAAVAADGASMTLVWSDALGRSALLVDGMAPLPDDQTYELWYLRDGDAIPAGTFDIEGDHVHSIVLDGVMHAGDAVGVTVEPAGGSPVPTSDPLVVLESA